MQANRDCKIKTFAKASAEDIVEQEDSQPNNQKLGSCDAPCCSPRFDPSNRHLFPICPKCKSNEKVAGIYYASVGPLRRRNADGVYELSTLGKRIEVDKTVVMAGQLQVWLTEPRPMWHCHNCEHNFR